MTIENLKQIAIKYATTKGSRVPLAPDELCNAVVQYFNEFLKITADINTIQVAVTEEGGNIVFTITGNTLDGKAFTPIVITVDHNDFVTDQEFEEFKTTTNAAIQKNTESINSLSFRVEDTENDITTIQVQVGQINTRVGNTETDVTNLKNRVDNTETNIAEINSTLENKAEVINLDVSNRRFDVGNTAYSINILSSNRPTVTIGGNTANIALENDIINEPIYFISFYANEPSEPCRLIGTIMLKNSYGTGQKTNEEFAVMLADNLYTNSNEGLAVYGRLANKDILCIYSEDGLSIRCLDEEYSEVDLPTVMFFVMETEL